MAARGRSITARWLTGSIGLIFVMLAAAVIVFSVALRSFYYNSADQAITAQANTVHALLTKYAADLTVDYAREARSLIESFDSRGSMELMAIAPDGSVITTSSGFEIRERMDMPDYEAAKTAADGAGHFRGRIGGENVVAVTLMAPTAQESLTAVRVIASLRKVDRLLATVIAVTAALVGAMMLLMLFSGLYFVRSIVMPVNEIGKTARRIARGDFNARLVIKNDDEIGALCETINDMAEELGTAERMKNDFISSVSHELRTPMTAIRGWSETINDAPEDTETVRKGTRIILAEADRLSQMVEELLDFSRIQSGRLKLNLEKIELLEVLEHVVELQEDRARREGIELSLDEKVDIAVVMADRNRIEQVFINIIDNAIKYSDPGGSVRVTAEGSEDGYVVTVADKGCGISPRDLPHVKERFYKANLSRRGNGIGLAVTDQYVTMHRGTLEIASKQGEGTTVTIRLPNARRFEQLTARSAPRTNETDRR